MRRSLDEKSTRKIFKSGGSSYAITLPKELIKDLGWKNKQKVVVKKYGKGLIIKDWKK